jgi:pimeloyl-ACP methyl ester carboxylesterase
MPKGPATPASPAVPRVRRGYFESRYGQLHVHNAIPPGGGFDEGTSLLCLHATPRSGSSMLPLLKLMGMDRSAYAPDLPGYGNSDAPTVRPGIADYATVVGDFCTTMRFRHLDILGYQTGALVAAELAMALPAVVRRVVLVGVPVPDEAERESFRRAPWPVAPTAPTCSWNGIAPAMRCTRAQRSRPLPRVLPTSWPMDRLPGGVCRPPCSIRLPSVCV